MHTLLASADIHLEGFPAPTRAGADLFSVEIDTCSTNAHQFHVLLGGFNLRILSRQILGVPSGYFS